MKKFNFEYRITNKGPTKHTPIYAEDAAEAKRKLKSYGGDRLIMLSCKEVPIEDYFKGLEVAR